MILNVYAVFDKKLGNYATPFFMKNHGLALRAFGDLVMDPSTTVSRHAEDFSLYYLGAFDDETGELLNQEPVHISHAVDFKNEN